MQLRVEKLRATPQKGSRRSHRNYKKKGGGQQAHLLLRDGSLRCEHRSRIRLRELAPESVLFFKKKR